MGLLTYQGGMVGSGGAGASARIQGAVYSSDLITAADFSAGGIKYLGHLHTGDSGGNTSPPK